MEPTVSQVLHTPELRALDLGSVARRCAALRLDEINLRAASFIDKTAEGVAFRKDRVVVASKLPSVKLIKFMYWTQALPHNRRLTCPALGVEGMVPLASEMLHAMVLDAQLQIEQLIARRAEAETAA